MLHATEHYELESKRALKAAERATTLHERIRLLETARDMPSSHVRSGGGRMSTRSARPGGKSICCQAQQKSAAQPRRMDSAT
jgi:hypothetical protein